MPDRSPLLSLPLIQPSQAQKHVTHNEALVQLDALVQLSVLSAELSDPPSAPNEGDRYVVAGGPTGDWAGNEGRIALFQNAGWLFLTPQTGWRTDVSDTGAELRFDGSAWVPPTALGDVSNLAQLGINAAADQTNRLSVNADATLLNHNGAGHQLKLNKAAKADTTSLLFQTGFSGRAEMGTTGNDDFAIKVSADGAAFVTALQVDAATGVVSLPNTTLGGRTRLASDQTLFVRTDGNDVNDGLSNTPGGAFATVQRAVDVALNFDTGPFRVTVQVASGIYAEDVMIAGAAPGHSTLELIGDPASPDLVTLDRVTCRDGARAAIDGLTLGLGDGVTARTGAHVTLGRIDFAGAGAALAIVGAHVECSDSTLGFAAPVTEVAVLADYGQLSAHQTTFDLAPEIAWGSAAFRAHGFSLIWLKSAQFVGGAGTVTGPRYDLAVMSALDTAGAGAFFIPGDAPGAVQTGSIYV